MRAPILTAKQLCTQLKIGARAVTIVDHLSFALYPGKTLALVGESGCGKTMAALSLMRILPMPPALPSTGEVLYRNRNLLTLSEKEMRKIRGGKIGMIFQDPTAALNPVYTIGDQLIEAANLHLNLYDEEAEQRAVAALHEVGMPHPRDLLEMYPHQLSGGMRQRVMIAMALLGEPDILIADEPTTALDVTIQAQVLQLIRTIQQKRDMAVLLITHDMGVVAACADDVIVMYAGQEVERAPVQPLFDHLSHPYTQGLFASRPAIHKPKQKLHTIRGQVPSPLHTPTGCRFHPRCPYAMKKCEQAPVPLFLPWGNEDQQSRCLLYDGTEQSAKKKQHWSDAS